MKIIDVNAFPHKDPHNRDFGELLFLQLVVQFNNKRDDSHRKMCIRIAR